MGKDVKFNKNDMRNRLKEKDINKYHDNNNVDPYGYDFVPTISHWTNIDEQRKEVEHLENITNSKKQ